MLKLRRLLWIVVQRKEVEADDPLTSQVSLPAGAAQAGMAAILPFMPSSLFVFFAFLGG
ncbi:MAG: hypothetical protein AAB676_18890 [Verrucomicrobiota bacterium]